MDSALAEVLKARRAELGMSQAALAAAAGVNVRQVARYESGEQQPVLGVAINLADALGLSLSELAGQVDHGRNLGGEWCAGWEIFRGGERRFAIQRVEAIQHGEHLQLMAERTHPVAEGGFNWVGELRLWDDEALMGWYRGADGLVESKGTMYFLLDSSGREAAGRYVGRSFDGGIITGAASLARTPERAELILADLDPTGMNT